ncbi:thiomuracin/GE37468 family thiazolyl RiPP peptide [Streptomyces nanhaiensis]|uniref:thiomuracin/GE37468 family thiazolyl RiPP peptide n=1 Tax=Streptomyces nanhaiensis TaxID=679319 RepID=UPI00399D2059
MHDDLDLDDLPLDVFELTDEGLTVQSLTAGHGMGELDASAAGSPGSCTTCCSCVCSS